jgi:hypothetical protein
MQLDIFNDSREVMLRNDVVGAIDQLDAGAVAATLKKLAGEFPHDQALPALGVLADAVARQTASLFVNHEALRDASRVLMGDIESAALRMLGAQRGTEWLKGRWRNLAERSANLPFLTDESDLHAAMAWLRAGEWIVADQAATRIPSWRRIPAPLGWVAEARYRADGLDVVWALLSELAWMSPSHFERVSKTLADPSLTRLLREFDANFEGDGDVGDLAWFPAWSLTAKPGLASLLLGTLPSSQSEPERGMRLLLHLLSLERQGRNAEMLDARKSLRSLRPSLYAAYMKTR